jgi:hypothetical protein
VAHHARAAAADTPGPKAAVSGARLTVVLSMFIVDVSLTDVQYI